MESHNTPHPYATTTPLPRISSLYPLPSTRANSFSHLTHHPLICALHHYTPLHSTTMGCAQSRPSANYYDEYFRPAQPPHRRYRSHRIANVDGYKPGPDYREHRQQYEQDVAADRYEDAYDRLTARSKLSTAHGLQEYYEDRGWS